MWTFPRRQRGSHQPEAPARAVWLTPPWPAPRAGVPFFPAAVVGPDAGLRGHFVLEQPARDLAVEEREFLGGFQGDLVRQPRIPTEHEGRPTRAVLPQGVAQGSVDRPQVLFFTD